ncbi:MAG: UMP kinase [Sphaerochaetaceae bacterium]|jgi:uridylate kinase
MAKVTVLSLGGSIIVPDSVDVQFLKQFSTAIKSYLKENKEDKIIIVTGGGSPARVYQNAYRAIATQPDTSLLDWIGIAATHLNGILVKTLFNEYCDDELVTDPTAHIGFNNRVLVAGGWKPGFSTDTDAVILAQRFNATQVINLSNIAKVYTADPKTDPTAQPIDRISWSDFRHLVGDEWIPGKNVPFDPIASQKAEALKLQVICADGRNIENLIAILTNKAFEGTVIG